MAEPGKNNYSEEDHSSEAQHATVYYRIKEIDQTNRESYSPVVRLSSTWNNVVSVYPNPAKNIIVISGHTVNGRLTVQIFDAAGKLVLKESWQLPVGNYSKTIRIENLEAGIYWLKIIGTQSDHWLKIIKE
jgi:hypothetical protein